jgi:hypothetical protein
MLLLLLLLLLLMQQVLLLIVFVVAEVQGRGVVDGEVVGLGVLPEEGCSCRGDT